MLNRDYETQICSIARSLEVIGERWSLLILRSVFLGTHRFESLREELGIARNILTTRLKRLLDEGVLERVPYQERPRRYEYRVTAKGRDLFPVSSICFSGATPTIPSRRARRDWSNTRTAAADPMTI